LTDVSGDTLRYLDFVARQAARTLLIITYGVKTSRMPNNIVERKDIPISWLVKELTTPATVLSSAPYSMTRIMAAVKKANCELENFEATTKEMEELFHDIAKVATSLTALLNQLRSQSTIVSSE
jgi:hypothetical protein